MNVEGNCIFSYRDKAIMRLFFIIISLLIFPSYAFAEMEKEKQTSNKSLFVELNSQNQVGPDCQVSFLMKNALGKEVKQFSFEVVIFNEKQQVEKLLVLKSGELAEGKTRVKRYGLKNLTCRNISRYLINDIKQCDAEGFTPKLCLQALVLSNKTTSKFGS